MSMRVNKPVFPPLRQYVYQYLTIMRLLKLKEDSSIINGIVLDNVPAGRTIDDKIISAALEAVRLLFGTSTVCSSKLVDYSRYRKTGMKVTFRNLAKLHCAISEAAGHYWQSHIGEFDAMVDAADFKEYFSVNLNMRPDRSGTPSKRWKLRPEGGRTICLNYIEDNWEAAVSSDLKTVFILRSRADRRDFRNSFGSDYDALYKYIERLQEQEINPSSDKNFDLDIIPIEILDKGWERYHPYTLTMDHRNPLANREVDADSGKQIALVRSAIARTFPIDESQFAISQSSHGFNVSILVALADDNLDIIENIMERKGFFRCQPNEDKLLVDRKNRKWLDVRFEQKEPNDVTEEVHIKFSVLIHLTPSIFEGRIQKTGLTVSTNDPDYRHSETRALSGLGDMSTEDIQQLAKTLFSRAQGMTLPNLSPDYCLFIFDLAQVGNDIRFFYDSNGLYTKVAIPPKFIQRIEHVTAR